LEKGIMKQEPRKLKLMINSHLFI